MHGHAGCVGLLVEALNGQQQIEEPVEAAEATDGAHQPPYGHGHGHGHGHAHAPAAAAVLLADDDDGVGGNVVDYDAGRGNDGSRGCAGGVRYGSRGGGGSTSTSTNTNTSTSTNTSNSASNITSTSLAVGTATMASTALMALNASGQSPLHLAATHGHALAVEVLVRGGAFLNQLVGAVSVVSKHLSLVGDSGDGGGGRPRQQGQQAGASALWLAAERGHAGAVRALLCWGGGGGGGGNFVEHSCMDVVRMPPASAPASALQQQELDQQQCVWWGYSALDVALLNGHQKVVHILRGAGRC
jgi:hypothetical protein